MYYTITDYMITDVYTIMMFIGCAWHGVKNKVENWNVINGLTRNSMRENERAMLVKLNQAVTKKRLGCLTNAIET